MLNDHTDSSVIVAAVQWLEGTLLGTIATTIAVIAVAGIGLMALSGRVDVRRSITVIIGCFILFGATSIVSGIRTALYSNDALAAQNVRAAEVSPLANLPKRPPNYDPYAGAAVPTR